MGFSSDQIKQNVKKFLTQTFFLQESSLALDDDTSFLENGIIDSTGILELINYIQDEFKFKVNDDEMLPDNLDSLNNIARYVGRKTS